MRIRNALEEKTLRHDAAPVGHHMATDTCLTDPDLVTVLGAWDRRPAPIRRAIVALVKAASG
jgi:hypothetical protein